MDMGEYAKAEPLLQTTLRIRQKAFGPEHLETATSLNNLAMLFWLMGEYAKAEPLQQEALRIIEKFRGPDHPDTATSLNNLALLYPPFRPAIPAPGKQEPGKESWACEEALSKPARRTS
jgi:hypothetical protein